MHMKIGRRPVLSLKGPTLLHSRLTACLASKMVPRRAALYFVGQDKI